MVQNFGFGMPFAWEAPQLAPDQVASTAAPSNPYFKNYQNMTPEELQAAQSSLMGDLATKQSGLSQAFTDRVAMIDGGAGYQDNYDLARESAANQWGDLQNQQANQSSAFGSYFSNLQQGQARQQQAYQAQQGGSAQGGMLPANYSTPFQGQITGATMPMNQPWGSPGFGGPNNGGSIDQYNPGNGGLGGLGGMKTGSSWGGPFGAKNPFAPS